MDTKINKLVRVDNATEEQLADVQTETNRMARERVATVLDRIDRGESVEAFVFGIAFVEEQECEIALGGDGRATVGLIDLMQWAIVKQTLTNGLLLKALPQRFEIARESGADAVELIHAILQATELIEQQKEQRAANEADEAIKQAAA